MAKKSTAGSEEGGAEVAAAPVEAGETRPCESKAEALHAIDELGYPVLVGPSLGEMVKHEKKLWAIAAIEKVFGEGPGGPGKVFVARPKFK